MRPLNQMSRQCRFKVELIQLGSGSAHEKYAVRTKPSSAQEISLTWSASIVRKISTTIYVIYAEMSMWDLKTNLAVGCELPLALFIAARVFKAPHLGCAFTLGLRVLVPEYNTRWALMRTHLFLSTGVRIRARFQCPSTRSIPLYSGTKVGTGSLCARVFRWFRGVLPTINFFALFAKMASADGPKWTKDNLGTQSLDKAPFCTVPGN